jgi:NitT/TauT family transport system permease protein
MQGRSVEVRIYQALVLVLVFVLWHVATSPTLLPPFYFDDPNRSAFLFGEPLEVLQDLRLVHVRRIYRHLWVTLLERCSRSESERSSPFGPLALSTLRRDSRALRQGGELHAQGGAGADLLRLVRTGRRLEGRPRGDAVFFVVFFNVYQGVREVSPVVLANARMLGATPRRLLRHVYLPSAMSWVFASLHNSVGLAFVGAVVGEYLGSAEGVGYLILQAEGVFDINTVMAGILVLTVFALLLDLLVSVVEKRLMVWQPRTSDLEKV